MVAIFSILLLVFGISAHAATITAASASWTNVGTAYQACSDGDVLQIPSGTAAWSNSLNVLKAIRIQGAGTNSTILNFGADVPMFNFQTASLVNTQMTLSDLQIAKGALPSSSAWFYVYGCNTNLTYMVCSNLYFNDITSPSPFVVGAIGVMTRCYWYITSSIIGCYIYHENWNGGLYSTESFYDPVQYGSDKFWVIENSIINRTSSTYAFTDAYRGARYVVRHCDLTHCWLECHGTESGFVRGTRAVESYFNAFHGDGANDFGHNLRSSTLICFSNTIDNSLTANHFINIDDYRAVEAAAPWGQATGDNPIDWNDSTVYDSGTATSPGTGLKSLTDSSKTWIVNQWVGYTLTRMTPATNTLMDLRSGYILANNATNITVADNIGGAFPDITFAAGDTYQIRKIIQAYDQPGTRDTALSVYRKNSAITVTNNVARATMSSHGFSTGDHIVVGDLYLGGASFYFRLARVTNIDSSTYTWHAFDIPDGVGSSQFEGWTAKISSPFSQTNDPCYEWGNTREGGVDVGFTQSKSFIVATTNYYNDTIKPGYTALVYPHWLVGGQIGATGVATRSRGGRMAIRASR